MAKQFIVRLKKGDTIVANSQIITVNGIGDGPILASDFSPAGLTGTITTSSRAGSFTKTIAAPAITATPTPTPSGSVVPSFNPVFAPTSAAQGVPVSITITGGPTAAVNGGTPVTVQVRKRADTANFFGSGYTANQWISTTGVVGAYTTITLTSGGTYTATATPFNVSGTAEFEFTFPTNSNWTYSGGGAVRTLTITISSSLYSPTFSWVGYNAANKTFDLDEFVFNAISIPHKNTMKVGPAAYKIKANAVMQLFTSRNTYTTSSGTRYGMYRDPDEVGLAYWTNRALVQGNSATSTYFLNQFFAAADAYNGELKPYVSRQLSYQNTYLSFADLPNLYRETVPVPANTPLTLSIQSAPPSTVFWANTLLPNDVWSNGSGTTDSSGVSSSGPIVTVPVNLKAGMMLTTIQFFPGSNNMQFGNVRALESNVAGIRSYNPQLTLGSFTTTSYTFNIDEFVDDYYQNPYYNVTGVSRAVYKAIAEDLIPLWTGRDEYTITNKYEYSTLNVGDKYYGLYRDVYSAELALLLKEGVVIYNAGITLPFITRPELLSWWFHNRNLNEMTTTNILHRRHLREQDEYISLSWFGKTFGEIAVNVPHSTNHTLSFTDAPPYTTYFWNINRPGGLIETGVGTVTASGTPETPPVFNISATEMSGKSLLTLGFAPNTTFFSESVMFDSDVRILEFRTTTPATGPDLKFDITANVDIVNEGDVIGWSISVKSGYTWNYGTTGRWVKAYIQGVSATDVVEAIGDPDPFSESVLFTDPGTLWPTVYNTSTAIEVNADDSGTENIEVVVTTWANAAPESKQVAGWGRVTISDILLYKPQFSLSGAAVVSGSAVSIQISGGPTSAAMGGSPAVVSVRKKANVDNFFGAGYVANTWISPTGIAGQTGNITLNSSGALTDNAVSYTVAGTAEFEFTFPAPPTGQTWNYNRTWRVYSFTYTVTS